LIVENETHQSALKSWLPPNATCSLLYRASTDGSRAADFHRCCDNKGPALVLIKSGEYIFGGYTSKSWESGGSWKVIADSQSFLFTLVNPSGNQPIKITPKSGAAIRCANNHGPAFGNSSYNDLRLYTFPNVHGVSHVSYLDLGHGFTCPENVNKKTYFTGADPSDVSELEVFKVNL